MGVYQKIQQTMCEMFTDRGYTISNCIAEHDALSDVSLMLKGIDTTDNIVNVFMIHKRMGKNDVKKFFEENTTLGHVILLCRDDFTSFAKQVLIEKRLTGITIEFFLHKEVMLNITKHKLQPKFEIMDSTEVQKLLKQLQCKLTSLNKILRTDPISRYYNAKPKQVFKITRDFMRGDNHQLGLNYRVVV